ncbi:unnamed protein product, partial [Rotaria socialis]
GEKYSSQQRHIYLRTIKTARLWLLKVHLEKNQLKRSFAYGDSITNNYVGICIAKLLQQKALQLQIDRALELIGVSNAKINQIMVKLSMNALNEKQTLQLISEENKQMEHKLAEVLLGYSTLSQQHTTSSLGSL